MPTDGELQDEKRALHYLKQALADFSETNNSEHFLYLLRQLTKTKGGMSSLSNKVGINRQNLYRTFATTGNPKFRSLATILKGLGYRLTVEPIEEESPNSQQHAPSSVNHHYHTEKVTEEVS
tara:strand:- start:647 stop:1012 length:366 start_codon:yes stop_codon:yes gene_type:complete